MCPGRGGERIRLLQCDGFMVEFQCLLLHLCGYLRFLPQLL